MIEGGAQQGDPEIKVYVKQDDLKKWQSTLNYYLVASKKSLEEVILSKSREVLYYLSNHVKADVGGEPSNTIGYRLSDGSKDSLKLTAWLLKKRALAGKIEGLGTKIKEGKYKGKRIARIMRTWQNKKGETKQTVELLNRGKYYTRDYARKFAKKHSNTRWGHRQFVYVLPFKTAQALLDKATTAGINTKGRKPQPPTAKKKLANVSTTVSIGKDAGNRGKSNVFIRGSYTFVKPDTMATQPAETSAMKLDAIYSRNMAKALRDSIKNMSEYIARKVKKAWSRHMYHSPQNPTAF